MIDQLIDDICEHVFCRLVKLDFRIEFRKKSLRFALLAQKHSVLIGHWKDQLSVESEEKDQKTLEEVAPLMLNEISGYR